MMDMSSNMNLTRQDSLRWHLAFKEEQMKTLASNFFIMVGSNSQTVTRVEQHFVRMRIDKIEFFRRVVENFFYGYLPFPVQKPYLDDPKGTHDLPQ